MCLGTLRLVLKKTNLTRTNFSKQARALNLNWNADNSQLKVNSNDNANDNIGSRLAEGFILLCF